LYFDNIEGIGVKLPYRKYWLYKHIQIVGLPKIIELDATCSGFQHFSGIFGNRVTAGYVNMDGSSKVDLYQRVGAILKDLFIEVREFEIIGVID
jgi:hypothetical protein